MHAQQIVHQGGLWRACCLERPWLEAGRDHPAMRCPDACPHTSPTARAAVFKAAEVAVKAVQKQSGVDLALRDVPLETLQVRPHTLELALQAGHTGHLTPHAAIVSPAGVQRAVAHHWPVH